uniref:Nucleoporin NUP188 n=1 Tax=Mycena chlorophos TaxID=658473 RepID=A0ABQ0LYZ3_MYCCL|nr:predicted protein [Mycena chlorophos]
MSAESSKRSNLVDVSYGQLHQALSGRLEGTTIDQLIEYITPRLDTLRSIAEPFGKPSDASKKKIESGVVALSDGVTLRVDDADKEYVLAVSGRFQIDQVHALVLLRSFLYNKGLPTTTKETEGSFVDELVEWITPFYYSERLAVLRVLLPLFRAKGDPDDPLYDFATTFLPKLIADGPQFAELVLAQFTQRTRTRVTSKTPKDAAREAKQSCAEQLVLLEVLFATMWDYVKCDGDMVGKIYETAYETGIGTNQANTALLLDAESEQLLQDIATLWTVIMVEILELEALADPANTVEISATPREKDVYTASPQALQRIHQLVTSNDDGQYVIVYVAWAFVLSRLADAASKLESIPDAYRPFFETILPHLQRHSKDREPAHLWMARTALAPGAGLFGLLFSFLTDSPLFVASVAWKRASAVTDPNATAYRSVIKGLIIAIVELTPVENIPDSDAFVDVWIALFGRSESKSVALICAQYWETDWHVSSARRAIFDVARSRFPIHFQTLIRLLRAMTGVGFLDTDPLCSTQEGPQTRPAAQAAARDSCARHVYYYLESLSTYSQVIPFSNSTGPNAMVERNTHSNAPTGLSYASSRQIRLPGGSVMPVGIPGRLLNSDGAEWLIVCWQHQHSGWKLILEVLTDYVNRRQLLSGGYSDVSFAPRNASGQPVTVRLEDIGVETNAGGVSETVITHALDLVQSLIQDNPAQAEQLMQAFEAGDPVVSHTMTEARPPDLVQLTTMILEDALTSAAHQNTGYRTQLITSAMSVLSAILALPRYAHRVWLYVRSTAALFGERSVGFGSVALAAERVSGRYTMTLGLLHLVQQLANEAFASVLPDNPKLLQLKEEVLMRGIRFVHTEVWVEHLSWKYAQKAERYDIGKQVMALYGSILGHAPPVLDDSTKYPFAQLLQAIIDLLLFKATTSTINPLVSTITSGLAVLESLYDSRLHSDVRRLVFCLEEHLHLARVVLNLKINARVSKPSLLEQSLCARVTGTAFSRDLSAFVKADPIDVLALYVKQRGMGNIIPVEAMRVLCALCSSFAMATPSPPTIIAHLNNPEATVASFVQIIQHPYEDMALRSAVWNFLSLAVASEPALGGLFVMGQFRTPAHLKGKAKAISDKPADETSESALDVATHMLGGWNEMWEMNPQLLASILRFLEVVWQHGLEHRAVLQDLRESSEFWDRVTKLACAELGPVPEYESGVFEMVDGVRRSAHHEVISVHAYRTLVKSYALKIIAHDVGMHFAVNKDAAKSKPTSFSKMEPKFRAADDLGELLAEATPTSYDPSLYDELAEQLKESFPTLTLEQVRSSESADAREFGDDFIFSTALFKTRLNAYQSKFPTDHRDSLITHLHLINMNLSLTQSQTALAESWQLLLQKTVPYLRGDATVGPLLMASAASIAYDIAAERRSGDLMATIHGTRLALLLAVLEVVWFATTEKKAEVDSFVELVNSVHNIILNEAQPPAKSFLGAVSVPFHRTLLLILYFCARNCGILSRRPKALSAEQRLKIASMIDAAVAMVIEALRVVLDAARSRVDVELDRDMEFLVSLFEQCTRSDVNPSTTLWLVRCQETDIIRASLDVFVHIDLAGLSDLPLLLARKQPLYAPHILLFHMALASIPSAAERFASAGVLAAYSNNSLSAAISAGMVDVTLPELPAHRSPAHTGYCAMLSIVSGVVTALGRQNHYFDAEASGLIQLYGEQIIRALSWTIGDPITLPLVEEMEQVVNVFYSIAEGAPLAQMNVNPAVERVLHAFPLPALRLLQQLNYALTHPNHLASLFEPITAEERTLLEKDPPSLDPLKRPLIAHLVHRLFRLSSNILSTLVTINRAYSVLTSDKDDWPVHEALILPHSKVVLGEPASMGTLLELGNCTLDVLRDLVGRPAGQSLADVGAIPGTFPLDVRQGVSTARRNLEALLIYAVTQLVMSLSKPDSTEGSSGGGEMETDGDESSHVHGREVERRGPRASLSLADRLRRGVTGEMAADLQTLITKAKPVVAKCDAVVGGPPSVDLTGVLVGFLQERIVLQQ